MVASAMAALVFTVAFAYPGAAQTPPKHRVMVVTVDGTELSDWTSKPNLSRLLSTGSSALISTRTSSGLSHQQVGQAAYRTLGAGRRVGPSDEGSALANAISAAGSPMGAFDLPALGAEPLLPPLGPFCKTACPPGPSRQSLDRTKAVTVVSGGQPDSADPLVGYLIDHLEPTEALMVLATYPTDERLRDRIYLAPIAATGFGFPPGLLTSPSTRRTGIVTLADVAPTILAKLGITPPSSMTGQPMTVEPEPSPASTLTALAQDLERVAGVRSPLLRGLVWISASLLGLLAFLLVTNRRRSQTLISVLLSIAAGAPFALVVLPLLPAQNTTAGNAIEVGIVASVVGIIAFFALGKRYALGGICALTAVVILGDLAFGGYLAMRSPLSYLIASGDRFFGIGNELMGVVVGCVLVALARTRASATVMAIAMAIAAGLLAVPVFGAKLGSVFVTIPAFGLLAYRKRPTWIVLAMLEVIAAGAAVVLTLVARFARSGTHFATASSAASNGTLGRKVSAAFRLLAFSYWSIGFLVFAVIIALMWRRRGSEPLLYAGAIAVAGALAFNDAGTIAAMFIAFFIASAQLTRQEPEVLAANP